MPKAKKTAGRIQRWDIELKRDRAGIRDVWYPVPCAWGRWLTQSGAIHAAGEANNTRKYGMGGIRQVRFVR